MSNACVSDRSCVILHKTDYAYERRNNAKAVLVRTTGAQTVRASLRGGAGAGNGSLRLVRNTVVYAQRLNDVKRDLLLTVRRRTFDAPSLSKMYGSDSSIVQHLTLLHRSTPHCRGSLQGQLDMTAAVVHCQGIAIDIDGVWCNHVHKVKQAGMI